MGKKTYAIKDGTIIVTDRRQLSRGAIVPNYVVDLYLPIIGYHGLGILTMLYRLANKKKIIANLAEYARAGRIGYRKLNETLKLLEECLVIKVYKPTGNKRLKHFRTEILLLDPPVTVPQKYADVVADRTITKWLMADLDNFNQPASELLDNNSGMTKQQSRNGQPATLRDVPSVGCTLCGMSTSASAADRVSGNKKKKLEEDPLTKAITEVFKTAPGQTRAIYHQMIGQTSQKNINHISDFDPPATLDEVHAFAKWWSHEYPRINLPTSPVKLQNHFYAFRTSGKKKRRRRVSDGRWLDDRACDEDLQRWMDQGPAKVENGRILIRENGQWCDIGPAPQKKKEASR